MFKKIYEWFWNDDGDVEIRTVELDDKVQIDIRIRCYVDDDNRLIPIHETDDWKVKIANEIIKKLNRKNKQND